MLKTLAASLFFLSALIGPAHAQGDPVYEFSESDPGMSAAISKARATLDTFLDKTMQNGQSGPQTMLKVAIPTSTVDEVIWITPFVQRPGAEWMGILANQPHFIEGANAGDAVTFTTEQIADWAIFDAKGVMYGGYTIREMVASGAVTPDMVPTMSADPVPAAW